MPPFLYSILKRLRGLNAVSDLLINQLNTAVTALRAA